MGCVCVRVFWRGWVWGVEGTQPSRSSNRSTHQSTRATKFLPIRTTPVSSLTLLASRLGFGRLYWIDRRCWSPQGMNAAAGVAEEEDDEEHGTSGRAKKEKGVRRRSNARADCMLPRSGWLGNPRTDGDGTDALLCCC